MVVHKTIEKLLSMSEERKADHFINLGKIYVNEGRITEENFKTLNSHSNLDSKLKALELMVDSSEHTGNAETYFNAIENSESTEQLVIANKNSQEYIGTGDIHDHQIAAKTAESEEQLQKAILKLLGL